MSIHAMIKKIFFVLNAVIIAALMLFLLYTGGLALLNYNKPDKGWRKNFIISSLVQQHRQVEMKHKQAELRLFLPRYRHMVDFIERGGVYNKEKNNTWDGFLAYYKKAGELFPEQADAQALYGFCLYHRGKMQEALDAYQKSWRKEPDYFWTLYNLGVISYETGDVAAAVSWLAQAVHQSADKSLAVVNTSPFYRGLWRHVRSPERVIPRNIKQGYQDALRLLLICLYDLKEYPDMARFVEAGLRGGMGNTADLYYLGGMALYQLKKYDEAAESFEKSLNTNSRQAGASYYLGLMLKRQGQSDAAAKAQAQAKTLGFDESNPFGGLEPVRVRIF